MEKSKPTEAEIDSALESSLKSTLDRLDSLEQKPTLPNSPYKFPVLYTHIIDNNEQPIYLTIHPNGKFNYHHGFNITYSQENSQKNLYVYFSFEGDYVYSLEEKTISFNITKRESKYINEINECLKINEWKSPFFYWNSQSVKVPIVSFYWDSEKNAVNWSQTELNFCVVNVK